MVGLIEAALVAGRDSRTGWRQRADGWTPRRIRIFLQVLARGGVVADAARAAGISRKSAYAFRDSAKGGAFDEAWRAAVRFARYRPAEARTSRVVDGCIVPIIRRGKLWGVRHTYDNRATMAALTRLDRLAASRRGCDEAVLTVAADLERFIEANFGGEGNGTQWQP